MPEDGIDELGVDAVHVTAVSRVDALEETDVTAMSRDHDAHIATLLSRWKRDGWGNKLEHEKKLILQKGDIILLAVFPRYFN